MSHLSGPVRLGVIHKTQEASLADQVMSEVASYDPNLVDQSNQSFKASREFAEQIAPIIHTPKQQTVVSFRGVLTGNPRCRIHISSSRGPLVPTYRNLKIFEKNPISWDKKAIFMMPTSRGSRLTF